MAVADHGHRKAVIGNAHGSFWLFDSEKGFDLTHPSTPDTDTISRAITIETTTLPIAIDPSKSALVIIDMQNFFLSPALGRSAKSKGMLAQQQLLDNAIPAARKAGIQIVWLNWGVTQVDMDAMPPAVHRAMGFQTIDASQVHNATLESEQAAGNRLAAKSANDDNSNPDGRPSVYKGFGVDIGEVTLPDGEVIGAGALLVRDQWNSDLTPDLRSVYNEGLKSSPPDVWIHKNRMSGFWGGRTPCTDFLNGQGITTLFFAGVNTDQCVGGSLIDAYALGYDCVLLSDGSGTSSPSSSQECFEYNAAKVYGFCTSCKNFRNAVR